MAVSTALGTGGTTGWDRKVLVAETGMSTCSLYCAAVFPLPLTNTQVHQRNFYMDATQTLVDYYRQEGSARGFLGIVWYSMADWTIHYGDFDRDDGAWSVLEATEWNFGLLEVSQPGTYSRGGYHRGENPKCALAWLTDFQGEGLKPDGSSPGVTDRDTCLTWVP